MFIFVLLHSVDPFAIFMIVKNTHTATAKRSQTRTVPTTRAKSLRNAVIRANGENASRRVKQFATDDGLVDYLDSLPAKKMPAKLVNDKTANGAELRREWCEAHGIAPVRAYDDGFSDRRVGKPLNKDGWRPENAILQRLTKLATVDARAFHMTRYETNPVQLATALALDWSAGIPTDFDGADLVYIYRV
jgi:hypothetical protein